MSGITGENKPNGGDNRPKGRGGAELRQAAGSELYRGHLRGQGSTSLNTEEGIGTGARTSAAGEFRIANSELKSSEHKNGLWPPMMGVTYDLEAR